MTDGNPDTGRALLGPERDPGRRWSEHILPFETLDQSYLEQFRNVGESHPRRKKIKSKLRELKKLDFIYVQYWEGIFVFKLTDWEGI